MVSTKQDDGDEAIAMQGSWPDPGREVGKTKKEGSADTGSQSANATNVIPAPYTVKSVPTAAVSKRRGK